MSTEHVVMFLQSMEQPEMADEVLNMHNRLEAFASGLDRACVDTMTDRIAELERQNAELRKVLQALEDANNEISRLRTHDQYLSMLDSGQQDALIALDNARFSARYTLQAGKEPKE